MKTQFDSLFLRSEEKHSLVPGILKALAFVESSWNPKAYRYEPAFWERYMKGRPEWDGKDPKRVAASYGLCQLMYSTAVDLGYRGDPEGLWEPEVNIDLAGKLMKRLTDEGRKIVYGDIAKYDGISSLDVALARYNGGSAGNPREDGTLRNKAYADKVYAKWLELNPGGSHG